MPYTPWVRRKFGVEMETREVRTDGRSLSLAVIAQALRLECTLPVNNTGGYGHSDGTRWDVKTDASCGFEVAGPALMMDEQQHCDELRRGCRALTALTPRIDRTCGLHVHVDCSDFSWTELQTLVSLWCRYEPFFYALIPPVRRTNMYCKAMRRHTPSAGDVASWGAARGFLSATNEATARTNAGRIEKYHGLNFAPWFRNGRVEFRLHSGTTEYDKIRRWVALLLTLVGRVKNRDMAPVGQIVTSASTEFPVRYVCKVLGLIATPEVPEVPDVSGELVQWIETRRASFDPASRGAATARPATPRARPFAGMHAEPNF